MSPPIAFIYLRETPAETVKMASYQYVEGSIPAHSPFLGAPCVENSRPWVLAGEIRGQRTRFRLEFGQPKEKPDRLPTRLKASLLTHAVPIFIRSWRKRYTSHGTSINSFRSRTGTNFAVAVHWPAGHRRGFVKDSISGSW